MQVSAAEVPDTPRLADVVNVDPIIATGVLRRVNSAFYGVRRRVSEVRQAVFLLGFDEVCQLVTTASMLRLRDVLHSDEQVDLFDRLLRTSLTTAFYADLVAYRLRLPARKVAFGAGLLHDVGRFVLLYNVPDTYEALWLTRDDDEAPTADEERHIFGLDHITLGAEAARHWNLPDEIAEVIRSHESPAGTEQAYLRPLVEAVAVGRAAARSLRREPAAAPAALADLCARTGHDAKAVADDLEAHRNEAAAYAEAMMA